MATWKVIATVSGNIEAVSGPDAEHRPGTDEWIAWEGEAVDKAEALKCAEKADPRVDLEWMRVGTRQETYKSEQRPRDESEPSSSPQAALALNIIAAGAFGDSGIW